MGTLFHTRKPNFPKTGFKYPHFNPPPPKNYKKFPRINVKRWTIQYKKCPDLVSRGKRWQLETIKEKQ
jgi:hypothetical protein